MMPYSSYEKFDFNVPTSTDNDVYARYAVRVAEMRESIKIVNQAMAGMPEGPVQADGSEGSSAGARADEDADGIVDLPLQDRHRGH